MTSDAKVNLPSAGGCVDIKVHGRVPWCADMLTELRNDSGRTFCVFTPRICMSPHLYQSVIHRYDNCVSNYRPSGIVSQVKHSFVLRHSPKPEDVGDKCVRLRSPTSSFPPVFVIGASGDRERKEEL